MKKPARGGLVDDLHLAGDWSVEHVAAALA
jgi:hypothetical protein